MDSSGSEGARPRRGLGAGRGARGVDSDGSSGEPHVGLGSRGVLGGGGRKRRRKQDDTSIFGVFAEGGGEGKGGKRGKNLSVPQKAVAFVPGETVNKMEVPSKSTRDDRSEGGSSGDEFDPRFRFDGPADNPSQEMGPKPMAKNTLSFGQMEANYGKGFKLLKKMGFDGGGLGARGEGIANPIEVMKRKDREALQDEGEKVDQDLYGQNHAGDQRTIEELLGSKPKKKQRDAPDPAEGWKKSSKERGPRVEYKSASQVASEPRPMRIVDMRGPQVQIASSFSELAASLSGTATKSLKELRYNTRQLVLQYEEKIRTLAERKRHYEDVLLAVKAERDRLEVTTSLGQPGTQRCRELAMEIDSLNERRLSGEVGLREIGKSCISWQEKSPQEFQALQVLNVGLALAVPAAVRELAVWRPLENPKDGLALLAPWVSLTAAVDTSGKTADAGAQAFRRLCDAALLPRLRAALSVWRVRESEPCLRLLEQCQAVLPAQLMEDMATELVLPRLMAEVEAWDPRVDMMSPHLWVHPWLPMLGERARSLWPPIRFKLSACLERWSPRDRSALEMLRPWQRAFDAANWDPLLEKVLRKLEVSLSVVSVRPNGQDVEPVQDVLAWVGVAPPSGLAHILNVAFFPQWHAALRDWLKAPGCDFSEVLQWYQGWKALFAEQLRDQGAVQRQLASGLEVMKYFMAKGVGQADGDEPQPPPASTPAASESSGHTKDTTGAVTAQVEEVSLSLSDYLAEVAGEHGLVFRPKRINETGKQVYQFGSTSIYLEKSLIYAAPKGASGAEWRPASMDEVLAWAKSTQAGGSSGRKR